MALRRVLITGAGGFVARHAVPAFASAGWAVRVAYRGPERPPLPAAHEFVPLGDFSRASWETALAGVDVVVHLAARAHQTAAEGSQTERFHVDNVLTTERLAESAAKAGVSRFVFLSSVKACGDASSRETPLDEDAPCCPEDDYGRTKLEAEDRLRRFGDSGRLPVAILRPPLVYGPGVRANFRSLMKVVQHGFPVPFEGIHNLRSFISSQNLASALLLSSVHPAAVGRTYFVSDGEDVSTSELLRRMYAAAGRPSRLFHVPPDAVRAAFALLGRQSQFDRLFGSLRVDITRIRTELGWRPPVSMQDALLATFAGFDA